MTEQTTPLDLDAIEVRHGLCASRHVVASRGEMEPTMLALAESAEDVPALVAEVRRLTAALAEVAEFAEELIGQGDEHAHGCRGQADCAACVHRDIRAVLTRTAQTGADR